MTRSSAPTAYDDDFFAWTQEQAAALRALPPGVIGEDVDIAHVAEEIEDMGTRDLREVTSFLARLIEHFIKVDTLPDAPEWAHWEAGAIHFQASAVAAFSPNMRRLLTSEAVWRTGRAAANRLLKLAGAKATALDACPFTLDELLAEDFDIDAALAKLGTPRPPRG